MSEPMSRLKRALKYLALGLYCVFALLPFVWMISASFKRPQDVLTIPVQWIPPDWQPGNYPQALLEPRFTGYSILDFMLNSLFVAFVTSLLSGDPAAIEGTVRRHYSESGDRIAAISPPNGQWNEA